MRPSPWEQRLERWAPLACRASAYLTAVATALPFVYHLARGSKAFLGLFEDDYFYYAIVADKFATLGKLTYDGTTLTNGFHPLWFATLVLLRTCIGRFTTPFYVVLTLVIFAAMLATYELSVRFARALGASAALAPVIAVAYTFAADRLMCTAMECVLAVPLFLWLLIEAARDAPLTPRRAAKLGFVASLAILGRLDIALAVGIMIIAWIVVARPSPGRAARTLSFFALGGVLLPLYAAANFLAFGAILPVSAQAKQLLSTISVNWAYVRHTASGTYYGATVPVFLGFGLLSLILLSRRSPGTRPAARIAGGTALVFAVVFYVLNALTGWIFFGWYAYPLALAAIAGVSFIAEAFPFLVKFRRAPVAAALLVLLTPARAIRYFIQHGPSWSVADNSLLAMSYDLADHLRNRRGLFSMGAIAGVASYVIDKPVLQLEGLVADPALIRHLRNQDPLARVLADYGADYLIVSFAYEEPPKHDGCYVITEPNAVWAGKLSLKMKGEICSEPVERFVTPAGRNPWSLFSKVETMVFDLHEAHWHL